MKRFLVGMALLLALAGSPARAGIGKGNGEFGVDLGWTKYDATISDTTAVRATFRGGYHFTRLFQLEGEIGCMVADDPSLGVLGANVYLCARMVDGVFNFHSRNNNVVPYVLAGVGRATLTYNNTFAGDRDDSGAAYQGAAGVRVFFGRKKRVAVRLELSELFARVLDQDTTNGSFTGGFTWRLGPAL